MLPITSRLEHRAPCTIQLVHAMHILYFTEYSILQVPTVLVPRASFIIVSCLEGWKPFTSVSNRTTGVPFPHFLCSLEQIRTHIRRSKCSVLFALLFHSPSLYWLFLNKDDGRITTTSSSWTRLELFIHFPKSLMLLCSVLGLYTWIGYPSTTTTTTTTTYYIPGLNDSP